MRQSRFKNEKSTKESSSLKKKNSLIMVSALHPKMFQKLVFLTFSYIFFLFFSGSKGEKIFKNERFYENMNILVKNKEVLN